jgi:hypothetical protein
MAVLTVVAIVAAGVAFVQWQKAIRQWNKAIAERLDTEATEMLSVWRRAHLSVNRVWTYSRRDFDCRSK